MNTTYLIGSIKQRGYLSMKVGDLVRVFNFSKGTVADHPHTAWEIGLIIADPTKALSSSGGYVYVMTHRTGIILQNIKGLIDIESNL